MYFSKIATSVFALAALTAMPSASAKRGGPRGGRGGGRGGPFANATFVDITCSSTGDLDLTCDPRGESEDGYFVCRTFTNDISTSTNQVSRPPLPDGVTLPILHDQTKATNNKGDLLYFEDASNSIGLDGSVQW